MVTATFDVHCPCCEATLRIDAETRAIIAHTIPERPKPIEDLAVEIEGVTLHLAHPDELAVEWVGQERADAAACWPRGWW
jgi:hypothetical protein